MNLSFGTGRKFDKSFEASFHQEGRRFAIKALMFASVAYVLFFVAAHLYSDVHGEFGNQLSRVFAAALSLLLLLVFLFLPNYSRRYYVALSSLGVGLTWLVILHVLHATVVRSPFAVGELLPAVFFLVFLSFCYLRLPLWLIGLQNFLGVFVTGYVIFGAESANSTAPIAMGSVLREWVYLGLFYITSLLLARGIEGRERRLFEAQRSLAKEHAEAQLKLSEHVCYQQRLKHDIQQPIGALGIAIGMLRSKLKPTPEFSSAVSFVTRCHDAVAEMVQGMVSDDLREIPREASGAACDVSAPLQLIEAAFAVQAQDAGVRLVVRARSQRVAASSAMVVTVFTNLVSNAIKYRNKISTCPTVFIYARQIRGMAQLVVADNGIGIGQAERQKVSRKGYRAANGLDVADGQGLGLFQVSHILSKLEGASMQVVTRKGGGTRFIVEICVE